MNLSKLLSLIGMARNLITLQTLAVIMQFLNPAVGKEYKVGLWDKFCLLYGFFRAVFFIPSGTSPVYHVVLATEILSIPKSIQGDVIECGCWKGASTASLSLVCAKVGRHFLVADSFEGLPEDSDSVHPYPHLKVWAGRYTTGAYSSSLEETKLNVHRYGNIMACRWLPGYFNETLPELHEPIAFAFLDVDLASSLKDCIRWIWPLLVDGGLIYTDDSCDTAVVKVWFDSDWWDGWLRQEAPGYIGSGCGLPVARGFSSLGYARKVVDTKVAYKKHSWEPVEVSK